MSYAQTYAYESGYGYGYGYGSDDGSPYGDDPISGYHTTTRNEASATTYQHSVYADDLGHYYHSSYEIRTSTLDTLTQYQTTYYDGTYYTVYAKTYTPLDGVYASYGVRDTTSYDINTHTAMLNNVYFSSSLTTSYFSSHNYYNGTIINSYDVRTTYSGGYYDAMQSYYHGPNGSNASSVAGYHYT